MRSTTFRLVQSGKVVGFAKCGHGRDASLRACREVAHTRKAFQRSKGSPILAVPQVLDHDQVRATFLMAPVCGASLQSLLGEDDIGAMRRPELLKRVGEALRVYHGSQKAFVPLASKRYISHLKSRAAVWDAAPDLPALCARLTAISDVLHTSRHVGGFRHGDLHCKNILLNQQGRVGLIDFEYAKKGPLFPEIATFLIRVCCAAPPRDTAHSRTMIPPDDLAAFEAGYGAVAGPDFDAACLLSLASALVASGRWYPGQELMPWQVRRRRVLQHMAARAVQGGGGMT